jgi:hypothetical protein
MPYFDLSVVLVFSLLLTFLGMVIYLVNNDWSKMQKGNVVA